MLELGEQEKELCKNAYSKEKIESLQKSAEAGDAEAQYELGLYYSFDDDVKSVEYYIKAANQGHAAAMNNLASCYGNGRGITKDEGKAIQLWMKAAELGNAGAQFSVGFLFAEAKDYQTAKYWLSKAAEQGNDLAIQVLKSIPN